MSPTFDFRLLRLFVIAGGICLGAACGRLLSHDPGDGGVADASSDLGSDSGQTSSPDGGASDSGGNDGSDSGTLDSGTGFSIHWSSMALPTTANAWIGAIAGIGAGSSLVLYAADESPHLYLYTGGVWTTVYTDLNGAEMTSLWVSPSQGVFGAGTFGQTELLACPSGCTTPSAFTSQPFPSRDVRSVCGLDNDHVYAVGMLGSPVITGDFFMWEPGDGGWVEIAADTGSNDNEGCWVAPDGTVYIAALASLLTFNGSSFTPETINWPPLWTTSQRDGQQFYAIAPFGGTLYATGSGGRFFSQAADGGWSLFFDPNAGCTQFTSLAFGDDAGVAAGGICSGPDDAVFDGSQWAIDANPPGLSAGVVWGTSQELFVGGTDTGGSGVPLLFRGTR